MLHIIITGGVTERYKTTMAHHGPGVRTVCSSEKLSDHYLGLLVVLARVLGIEVEAGL